MVSRDIFIMNYAKHIVYRIPCNPKDIVIVLSKDTGKWTELNGGPSYSPSLGPFRTTKPAHKCLESSLPCVQTNLENSRLK